MRRQYEADLVTAVNELCNGTPSDQTIQMLKELSRPLENIPDDNKTRLLGTNFDARYMNEEMLDGLQGDVHIFRATDED